MLHRIAVCLIACLVLSACSLTTTSSTDKKSAGWGKPQRTLTLIKDRQSNCIIVAPPRVMADDIDVDSKPTLEQHVERDRKRLRESVYDLSHYLQKMSGAEVQIVTERPAPSTDRHTKPLVEILIAEFAEEEYGKPTVQADGAQGFRMVVRKDGVGLLGESDLAASYAIFELLDQLGCRWYMPGELGEVIPYRPAVVLIHQDLNSAPYTTYRNVWHASDAYKRRNRLGGVALAAAHALETYISPRQREENPDWRADINGKKSNLRLKWSNGHVAVAIADAIIAKLDANPLTSMSLSPHDGAHFDESPEDKALDAGDFDETLQTVSITDRLLKLTNHIATRVTEKHPDVLFGQLAYVQYTRPPVREKPHPNIIPQIAPITYRRAHSMMDDNVPNNKELREVIKGWAGVSPRLSYYWYAFYLAETATPNPFLTKWATELPFLYEHNCKFWMPETISNFETTMHALHLGNRLAWNPNQDPRAIFDELNRNFYGHAAEQMKAYWELVDHTWVSMPEYSGCGFGHMRRFPPETVAQWRKAMNEALAACKTITEYRRVKMADDSLILFEMFMQMREDLAAGNWAKLRAQSDSYEGRLIAMADDYAANWAFGRMYWTGTGTIHNRYFKAFYRETYEDAARIADVQKNVLLTREPIRKFRYRVDPNGKGEELGWYKTDVNDKGWDETDVCLQTWSTLGHHSYMGAMWYRTTVKLSHTGDGQRVFLWLGATDGSAKIFINGEHVIYTNPAGEAQDEFSGYCQPVSIEITEKVKANSDNHIAILCKRTFVNELGTGGLLAPIAIYREK